MALPNQIDASSPLGSDAPSTLDNQIRSLKQAIIDIFGVPSATNVSVAFLSGAAGGLDQVIFLNAAADATAAGRLRRNATNLTWHDGTAARNLATIDGGQTFTSAIWNGTAIGAVYGGTGLNTSSSTGMPSVNSGTWQVTAADQPGQVQLARTNATTLTLSPYNGNLIKINGKLYAGASAGVTLANTGLTASTLYYIYLYDNSGTLTLEASTTAYATDTATANIGVKIKNGDATRTLVGMIRTEGSTPGQFVDSATQRFVRSWFNDPGISGLNFFTASRSTTSTSWAEVNSEIRVEFVSWAGEIVQATVAGSQDNNTSNEYTHTAVGFDGTTPEDGNSTSNGAGGTQFPINARAYKTGLAEGYHYATVLGRVSSNTGGWYVVAAEAGRRTTLALTTRR